MKILGVDDNSDILGLLELSVMSMGHEFDSAPDGVVGLEKIRKGSFDMVFLDLAMPRMTGLEVIDKLAETGEIKSECIVLFTASHLGIDNLREKIIAKGAFAILDKPVDIEDIMKMVERAGARQK